MAIKVHIYFGTRGQSPGMAVITSPALRQPGLFRLRPGGAYEIERSDFRLLGWYEVPDGNGFRQYPWDDVRHLFRPINNNKD